MNIESDSETLEYAGVDIHMTTEHKKVRAALREIQAKVTRGPTTYKSLLIQRFKW